MYAMSVPTPEPKRRELRKRKPPPEPELTDDVRVSYQRGEWLAFHEESPEAAEARAKSLRAAAYWLRRWECVDVRLSFNIKDSRCAFLARPPIDMGLRVWDKEKVERIQQQARESKNWEARSRLQTPKTWEPTGDWEIVSEEESEARAQEILRRLRNNH